MKSRPKLAGAPLGYTMWKVDGAADAYRDFGRAIWADDATVSARLKELLFLRCSIVNACPT
jgi:hypothetical protein